MGSSNFPQQCRAIKMAVQAETVRSNLNEQWEKLQFFHDIFVKTFKILLLSFANVWGHEKIENLIIY